MEHGLVDRLAAVRTIEITTVGGRSGRPVRVEIWWFRFEERFRERGTSPPLPGGVYRKPSGYTAPMSEPVWATTAPSATGPMSSPTGPMTGPMSNQLAEQALRYWPGGAASNASVVRATAGAAVSEAAATEATGVVLVEATEASAYVEAAEVGELALDEAALDAFLADSSVETAAVLASNPAGWIVLGTLLVGAVLYLALRPDRASTARPQAAASHPLQAPGAPHSGQVTEPRNYSPAPYTEPFTPAGPVSEPLNYTPYHAPAAPGAPQSVQLASRGKKKRLKRGDQTPPHLDQALPTAADTIRDLSEIGEQLDELASTTGVPWDAATLADLGIDADRLRLLVASGRIIALDGHYVHSGLVESLERWMVKQHGGRTVDAATMRDALRASAPWLHHVNVDLVLRAAGVRGFVGWDATRRTYHVPTPPEFEAVQAAVNQFAELDVIENKLLARDGWRTYTAEELAGTVPITAAQLVMARDWKVLVEIDGRWGFTPIAVDFEQKIVDYFTGPAVIGHFTSPTTTTPRVTIEDIAGAIERGNAPAFNRSAALRDIPLLVRIAAVSPLGGRLQWHPEDKVFRIPSNGRSPGFEPPGRGN